MAITPIITSAASDAQREEAEHGLAAFVRSFEAWLATAVAFEDQDDIDCAALAAGIAAIQARAESGFDAATYLELQGSRSPGGLPIWEEVLLAALATHLLTIAERRRLRPLDLAAAHEMIAEGYRPVVNAKSGRPALMGKAASETREDGSVVARVRLVRPLQRQLLDRDQYARSSVEEVPAEAFAPAWQAELASLPEYDERTLYVVTGLLLPIWDRLPGINMRVFRLVTDAGERIVGRVVDPQDLHVTRKKLNLGAGTAMAPAEALAAVLGGRANLQLTGELQVKRVRVMNEYRVELIGASDGARAGLKALGLFSEVISFRTRLFIPTGERAASILAAVMERYALLRCVAAATHA